MGPLLRAAVGASLLAVSTPAWALTCDDIMSLVGYNIPTSTIVQTVEGSGSRFTADDVACLVKRGAPEEIVEAVNGMRVDVAEPEPEPAPEPESLDEDTGEFSRSDSIGSDDELGDEDPSTSDDDPLDEPEGPAKLEELVKLYRAKKLLTASKGLYDLLEEGTYPDYESKIHYYLCKSLYDLEMYHGAQYHCMEVVRKGPKNAYFKYALPKMVSIAELTGNDTELLRIVPKIHPEAYPRQARSHLYYLMGRKLYEDGELSEAAQYFSQISPTSDLYMRSKYFEGVIQSERGKLRSSVKAFRDVYQAEMPDTASTRTREELGDLKQLALIDIARIYFGLQRFDQAEEFYLMVDRESDYWPQSLFERAWTEFWQNDLNNSLGLLLTVDSPYFHSEEFIPEVEILRALTFFQLCEFDHVETLLLDFDATYSPMHKELKAFLDLYSAPESKDLYDQAYDAYFEQAHSGSKLHASLFTRVLRNRDLAALVRHLDMMDEEIALIQAQKGVWKDTIGAHLERVIEEDRIRYKKRAGGILLQELDWQYEDIGRLLTDAELIRFEVVDAQRLDYEYKMMNPSVETQEQRKVDFATSRDIIYWPFNGEFWRDELGYYRYTETPTCN